MAYTYDPIFAADPNNAANVAANASITIFDPADGTMAPITITDVTDAALTNPITVNKNGFGPAFQHATLDRVGWSGGGFTGYFTSYEGIKAVAVAAQAAAEGAAADAGADAAAVATAAIGTATDDAEAAAASAATAATNASASATAAANSAALVGAPADAAITAAINNGASATRGALNATYAPAAGSTVYAGKAEAVTIVDARGVLGTNFAFYGDSITNYGEGYPTYAGVLAAGAFNTVLVKSNPGDNSTALLAKMDAQIIAAAPKPTACVCLWGANDAQGSVTLATFKANTIAMVGKLRAAGIAPVLCTVPPNNNDTYDGFVRLYNAWLTYYAATERIALVDFYTLLLDQVTGNWKTAYDGGDGLHPNQVANKAMGQLVVDTLKPRLTPNSYTVQPFAGTPNLQPNSNFLIDTNIDGIADGLSISPVAGLAYSRVDDAAGFKWQRFTLSGAGSSNRKADGSTIGNTQFSIGDRIRASFRVRTGQNQATGSSGGAQKGMYINVTCYTPAYGIPLNTPAMGLGLTQTITAGIATAEFTVPATTDMIIWSVNFGPADGTYDIAQPTIYNLTRLGIA